MREEIREYAIRANAQKNNMVCDCYASSFRRYVCTMEYGRQEGDLTKEYVHAS